MPRLFGRHGQKVVILLCGGDKKSQTADTKRAEQDEARFAHVQTARLIEALKKRGVSNEVLDAAAARDTSVV